MNAVLNFKHVGAQANGNVDKATKPSESDGWIPAAGTPASNESLAHGPWSLTSPGDSAAASDRMHKLALGVLLALLHVFAIYAIVHWSPRIDEIFEPTLEVALLADATPQNQEIKEVIRPNLASTEVFVPVPTLSIAESESAIIVPVATTSGPSITGTAAGAGTPKLVSSVEYIRAPSPRYPAAARSLRQSGVVMLRALIDVNGHAREVTVQTSSGSRLLDDAGRTAVLDAQFKPYMENGRALEVYVLVPIEFGTAR